MWELRRGSAPTGRRRTGCSTERVDARAPGGSPTSTVSYAGAGPARATATAWRWCPLSQTRAERDAAPSASLRDQVARARAGLQRLGVGRGDRVVAYLPEHRRDARGVPRHRQPRRDLGVVRARVRHRRAWSPGSSRSTPRCCSPSTATGTAPRPSTAAAEVAELQAALPGPGRHRARCPYLDPDARPRRHDPVVRPRGRAGAARVRAGARSTTRSTSSTRRAPPGCPKPIVHGHGGILVEHAKALALQKDIGPDDRFFWFSTTGWMMWNFLVSGLLVGATVVCLRRRPGVTRTSAALWAHGRRARHHQLRHQRPVPDGLPQGRASPRARDHDLSAPAQRRLHRRARCRRRGSSGSTRRWAPTCSCRRSPGGTDVCSAFVGGSVLLPVRSGVIAAPCLGAKVEALSPSGEPLVGEQGELVISEPLPSMPVGFWGDDDGSRYRAAYFERFPGRWHHGDWITIEADGSCVISGRSDATLNRGGVRLGTVGLLHGGRGVRRGGRQPRRAPRRPRGRHRASCSCSSCSRRGRRARRRPARPHRRRAAHRSCRPATCPTRSTPCRRSRGRCRARSSRCR